MQNENNAEGSITNFLFVYLRAPDMMHDYISLMHISSPNPMLDHLLESSHRYDYNN